MSRFSRIDTYIDIGKLERETRPVMALAALLSIILNLSLGTLYFSYLRSETGTYVPDTDTPVVTRLITIPPRPDEPYEVREQPRTRNPYRRRTSHFRVSEDRIPPVNMPEFEGPEDRYYIDTEELITAIFAGPVPEEILLEVAPAKFSIPRLYQDMTIQKNPYKADQFISMQDEMIRIRDLDTGKYKGLVVLTRGENEVKGYIHVPATVWGHELMPPEATRNAMSGLAESLRKHTSLQPTIDGHAHVDSLVQDQYPFVYIAADDIFSLSPAEREGLSLYLRNGGFALIEAYGQPDPNAIPRGSAPLRRMLSDALGGVGRLEIIPNDHFLYHCFFHFPEGPPSYHDRQVTIIDDQPVYYLEGVFIGDRLVAVYSEKRYGNAWSQEVVSEPFQRMGVNLVVYAMIQQGSFSMRLADDGVER